MAGLLLVSVSLFGFRYNRWENLSFIFSENNIIMTADRLIQKYQLQPHPEGGWFRETYRAADLIRCPGSRGNKFPYNRNYGTAIYFLLKGTDYSAFHRIKADEIWHFYTGNPLNIFVLDENGTLTTVRLGNDPDKETFQYVVPANNWFAAAPTVPNGYSFVGCTVAPGFEFIDFELAQRAELSSAYPEHTALIQKLTRI